MKGCWKKSSIYLVAGLVVLVFMFMDDLAYAQKEILTIGRAESPVLRQVKGRRVSKDARALVREVKESVKGQGRNPQEQMEKEKGALMARFGNVDAVVADLSEVTPTDDDKLLAQAAKEAGVPIVLEKAAGAKMAYLLGVGVDASLAALESAGSGARGRIHIWDDSAEITDGPVEKKRVEPELTAEQRAELERRKAAGEKEQVHPPVSVGKSTIARETRGYNQAAGDVENILRNRPFSRGATSQAITDCTDAKTCYEVDTNWNPCYWNPGGVSQTSCLADQLEMGMYATSTNKYIVVRKKGCVLGKMDCDLDSERGYFLDEFSAEFEPASLPPSWVMENSKPEDATAVDQVRATTGFKKTATAVGYSTENMKTRLVRDWKATKVKPSSLPTAKIEMKYKLSNTSKGQYEVPEDLLKISGSLAELPPISKEGWRTECDTTTNVSDSPFAEVVWKGPANSTGIAQIALRSKMYMRRSWRDWYILFSNFYTTRSGIGRGLTWYFDTSRVSYSP